MPYKKRDHRSVVEALEHRGLSSVSTRSRAGGELAEDPTFYWKWSLESPFLIDYIFAPTRWELGYVQIGRPEEWLDSSDHMPITADLAPGPGGLIISSGRHIIWSAP